MSRTGMSYVTRRNESRKPDVCSQLHFGQYLEFVSLRATHICPDVDMFINVPVHVSTRWHGIIIFTNTRTNKH